VAQGTATLDGSASTDPDGKLVRFVWKKVSGPSAGVITKAFGSATSTTVTGLTTAGTYTYELSVVDDRASFDKDTLTIVVSNASAPVNTAPVAKAGNDVVIALPVSSVTVNGSASSDEDGTIQSYQWTKGSGPAVSIASPNSASTALNNLSEGTYVIRLKVTDDDGASAQDDLTITVNAAPPPPNKAP